MTDHDQNAPGIGLLTVLLGAVAAGPILLYGLSATSDSIIAELGISEAHFGLLATTCFGAAAIGSALWAGSPTGIRTSPSWRSSSSCPRSRCW